MSFPFVEIRTTGTSLVSAGEVHDLIVERIGSLWTQGQETQTEL